MPSSTMLDKIWDAHTVTSGGTDPDLLYVDMHFVQEVSSPQAFEALAAQGRPVRRPDLTLATTDHAIATTRRGLPMADDLARIQIDTLVRNARSHGIPIYGPDSDRQGIVHVIGPELGLTQPGTTIVCGDSHTSTHGAFGALAFGIGTTEIAHVLATQCLRQHRPKSMLVQLEGALAAGVTAKDIALGLISRRGTAFAAGHAIEYRGPAVTSMSMEARMTLCNMSIESGGRAGMVAPDDTTFEYLHGRPFVAAIAATFEELCDHWRRVRSDEGCKFASTWAVDVSEFGPVVTWGTTPAMTVDVTGHVPTPDQTDDPESTTRALAYMGLSGGEAIADIAIDYVFIGSCTNGRIEDLRAAAGVVRGRRVASGVRALVVPGSSAVKRQAEREGLGQIFRDAGFEWRDAGCSMCVAINEDRLPPGARCASTSNRNFEGRQGPNGRTHLVSPSMAAAAAVAGHFVDIREIS